MTINSKSLRSQFQDGMFDIALEYNKGGKYWYAWIPKEPSIDVCKDEDMGECLHKLAWEIELFMEKDQ